MEEKRDIYVNPFTDYGFKKLFGEDPNKNLLIDFLNELLREEGEVIKEITYLPTERLGIVEHERKAMFDLYCENERGEKFIVEMQKSKQANFKDRTIFYSAHPIVEQGKRNNWDFKLNKVYMIAILDFVFEEYKNDPAYCHRVKLKNDATNKVFSDKLQYIYLEMPKFKKGIDELETRFDKWLYVIRNLSRLDRIPESLREKIFIQFFESAELAKFTVDENHWYQVSLKQYRDVINQVNTAHADGRAEGIEQGRAEGKLEMAQNMKVDGMTMEMIMKYSGLSEEEINQL
ncbi:MAG: Rpn family recombination-promoting nuclease/putative transposase [Mangrovibacterium sp.]